MTQEETFAHFVEERRVPMLKFAMVLTGDFHASEEIVAIVFAKAFEQWHRIGVMTYPQAYVRKMIVNEHLTWKRRTEVGAPSNEPSQNQRSVSDFSADVDEREAMVTRLAHLTPYQRTAIVLRYYLDMTDEEIAAHLGCRRSTARSHLSHAIAALRLDQSTLSSTPRENPNGL